MSATLSETKFIKLLNDNKMDLELIVGVSGVTIGYKISKVFYNRSKARVWVARILKAGDGNEDEDAKSV